MEESLKSLMVLYYTEASLKLLEPLYYMEMGGVTPGRVCYRGVV